MSRSEPRWHRAAPARADATALPRGLYGRIVMSATDGIWVVSPRGSTIWANADAAAILGHRIEEMDDVPVDQVLDDLGRPAVSMHLDAQCARGGTPDTAPVTVVRADGTTVGIQLSHQPLVDDESVAIGWIHRFRDVTTLAHLDSRLHRSEQQLSEAQRVAHLGSWDWDIAGDVLTWSDELYRIFGMRPDQVPASYAGYLAAIHPDDVATVEAAVGAAVDVGRRYSIEHRIVLPGGGVAWVACRGEVVVDVDGTPSRMRGTAFDITAAKHAEAGLRAANARYRLLSDIATGAHRAETLDDALAMAGRAIGGYTGWHLEDTAATDPCPGERARQSAAARDTGAPAWAPHPRSVGGTGECEGTSGHGHLALPVRSGHDVVGVLSFVMTGSTAPAADLLETLVQVTTQLSMVAERARAAADLSAARDAAMESSRLKSAFLATMSHEIRTPMNGVIGLTGLLLDTDLNPTQRQYADGVRTAGETLLTLVDDVLDFSKFEAGMLRLEVVDLDLRSVVEAATALLVDRAGAKGIDLAVTIEEGLPGRLRGDPVRVGQVLGNLLANAVKFTPAGSVSLRASLAGRTADTVVARFDVVDTGIGIGAADRARLFEPFTQADVSTTRRYGGTGLGLAICRQLVAAMGGELGVQSAVGRGSTFWFTVPMALQVCAEPAPRSEPARPTVQAAPDGAVARVLVVEDNATNQLVARGLLGRLGYHVDVAANGREALDALAGTAYAAILMDCQMPVMDGYTATAQIRRLERGARRTPIIAMTASAVAGDRERCLAVGMDDYLAKPIESRSLTDALARWAGAAA